MLQITNILCKCIYFFIFFSNQNNKLIIYIFLDPDYQTDDIKNTIY